MQRCVVLLCFNEPVLVFLLCVMGVLCMCVCVCVGVCVCVRERESVFDHVQFISAQSLPIQPLCTSSSVISAEIITFELYRYLYSISALLPETTVFTVIAMAETNSHFRGLILKMGVLVMEV